MRRRIRGAPRPPAGERGPRRKDVSGKVSGLFNGTSEPRIAGISAALPSSTRQTAESWTSACLPAALMPRMTGMRDAPNKPDGDFIVT